jgi:hypothetical protein
MRFIGEGNFNVVYDRFNELLGCPEGMTSKQVMEVRLLAHLIVNYEDREFPMGLLRNDVMEFIRKERIKKSMAGELMEVYDLDKLNMCWYLGTKSAEIDESNCKYFDMVLKVIGDHGDVKNPAIPMLLEGMCVKAKEMALECLKES